MACTQQESKIPVLTVIKNGTILKNIVIQPSPPSTPIAAVEDRSDQEKEETLTIGRHPDCNIVLTHVSVSRFHLQINWRRASRKLFVTDLNSVHGTWVRNEKIEPRVRVELNEGDTLRVGGSTRVYRLHWVSPSCVYDMESPSLSAVDFYCGALDEENDVMMDEDEMIMESENMTTNANDQLLGARSKEEISQDESLEEEKSSPSRDYNGQTESGGGLSEESGCESSLTSRSQIMSTGSMTQQCVILTSESSDNIRVSHINSKKKINTPSIWLRRGKPAGVLDLQTNRSGAEVPWKGQKQVERINRSVSKALYSNPRTPEQLFTLKKKNYTPNPFHSESLRCSSSRLGKIQRSSSCRSLAVKKNSSASIKLDFGINKEKKSPGVLFTLSKENCTSSTFHRLGEIQRSSSQRSLAAKKSLLSGVLKQRKSAIPETRLSLEQLVVLKERTKMVPLESRFMNSAGKSVSSSSLRKSVKRKIDFSSADEQKTSMMADLTIIHGAFDEENDVEMCEDEMILESENMVVNVNASLQGAGNKEETSQNFQDIDTNLDDEKQRQLLDECCYGMREEKRIVSSSLVPEEMVFPLNQLDSKGKENLGNCDRGVPSIENNENLGIVEEVQGCLINKTSPLVLEVQIVTLPLASEELDCSTNQLASNGEENSGNRGRTSTSIENNKNLAIKEVEVCLITETPEESKIPVLTVIKNGMILKNILIRNHNQQPQLSPSPNPIVAVQDGIDEVKEETMIIGRHPTCDIVLTHISISIFHLHIIWRRSSQKLLITDLNSVTGTWVRDEKIKPWVPVELHEGDTFKVGFTKSVYELHWVSQSHSYNMENSSLSTIDLTLINGALEEENDEEMFQEEMFVLSENMVAKGNDSLLGAGKKEETSQTLQDIDTNLDDEKQSRLLDKCCYGIGEEKRVVSSPLVPEEKNFPPIQLASNGKEISGNHDSKVLSIENNGNLVIKEVETCLITEKLKGAECLGSFSEDGKKIDDYPLQEYSDHVKEENWTLKLADDVHQTVPSTQNFVNSLISKEAQASLVTETLEEAKNLSSFNEDSKRTGNGTLKAESAHSSALEDIPETNTDHMEESQTLEAVDDTFMMLNELERTVFLVEDVKAGLSRSDLDPQTGCSTPRSVLLTSESFDNVVSQINLEKKTSSSSTWSRKGKAASILDLQTNSSCRKPCGTHRGAQELFKPAMRHDKVKQLAFKDQEHVERMNRSVSEALLSSPRAPVEELFNPSKEIYTPNSLSSKSPSGASSRLGEIQWSNNSHRPSAAKNSRHSFRLNFDINIGSDNENQSPGLLLLLKQSESAMSTTATHLSLEQGMVSKERRTERVPLKSIVKRSAGKSVSVQKEGIIRKTAQGFCNNVVNQFSERFVRMESSCRGLTWLGLKLIYPSPSRKFSEKECAKGLQQDSYYEKIRQPLSDPSRNLYSGPSKKFEEGDGAKGLKLILKQDSHYGKIKQPLNAPARFSEGERVKGLKLLISKQDSDQGKITQPLRAFSIPTGIFVDQL